MIVDVTRIDEQNVDFGLNGSLLTPVAKLSPEINVIFSQKKPLWRFPANLGAIFHIDAHQICPADFCNFFEYKPALAATHSEFYDQTRLHTRTFRKYRREMVSNVTWETLGTVLDLL
jgi:hypothetical protein